MQPRLSRRAAMAARDIWTTPKASVSITLRNAPKYYAEAVTWCRESGAKIAFLHTSGHASGEDLRAFGAAMSARMVVPVHGTNWDHEGRGFANLSRLEDGEPLVITASDIEDKSAARA